jgi:hypothetical protein
MERSIDDYWTTKKLAEAAGLDPSRIRQLLDKREITGVKVAGTWFIEVAEARAWLATREQKKESPSVVTGLK